MAYYTLNTTLVGRQSTDAELQAIVTAIHNALVSMGLIQTADTGQINPATVVRVGANLAAGYEIWRFADTLQATSPVFMKIEYGTSGGVNGYSMWLTIGTGSNGSGTITGIKLARRQIAQSSVGTSSVCKSLMSGDTDRFMLAMFFDNAASVVVWMSVERQLTALGARVGTGLYVSTSSTSNGMQNNGSQSYVHLTLGVVGGEEADLGILVPLVGSGVAGADVYVYPQYFADGVFIPFGLNQLAYFNTAIPVNSLITFQLYGSTRQYYTLGSLFANTSGQCTRGGPTGVTLMVRAEP